MENYQFSIQADNSTNSVKMGALDGQKQEHNQSIAGLPLDDRTEIENKVYRLMIHIDKIRPKPCPKSKKLAFSASARKREQMTSTASVESSKSNLPVIRKEIPCPFCHQVYQSAQSLYLHKKKHLFCDICQIMCETKAMHEIHENLHGNENPAFPYKCHLCPEIFDSKDNVRSHIETKHSIAPSAIGASIARVVTDPSRFEALHGKSVPLPVEAIRLLDNREPRPIEIDNNEKNHETAKKIDEKDISNYGGLKFTCGVCCKDFITLEAAEGHTREHMEIVEPEHRCNICNKIFKTDTLLSDHLAQHLSRAHKCPVCHKAFINGATLRKHLKTHDRN